jgi:hypothetical protein
MASEFTVFDKNHHGSAIETKIRIAPSSRRPDAEILFKRLEIRER